MPTAAREQGQSLASTALAVTALALSACAPDPPAPRSITSASATAPPAAATPPTNTAARVPAGWTTIDPPSKDRIRCANYSEDEWQVSVAGDQMKLTKAAPHEPDTGPALKADPPGRKPRGRRHVVAIGDGFLAGYDAGEWGGALYWLSKDGANPTELGQENVHGLVALSDVAAVSFEGLAHLSMNEGAVRWLERAGPGWRTTRVDKLDGVPQAFVAAPDAIYLITLDSLVRVRNDGGIETVQPLATLSLYPDSMAVDAAGQLWIGMRQLVLRLTPTGATYAPQWFVEERCRDVSVAGLGCVCNGAP